MNQSELTITLKNMQKKIIDLRRSLWLRKERKKNKGTKGINV